MRVLSVLALVGLMSSPALAGGDAAAGKAVFDTNCSSCHGATGAGDGPAGAALNPKPASFATSALDEAAMLKMVTEGGAANGRSPLMLAWKGTLNEKQIADVVAYVRSFKK